MESVEITATAIFVYDFDEFAYECEAVFGPDYTAEEYAAYCKSVVHDLLDDPFSLEFSVTTRVLDSDVSDVVG